MPLTALFPQAQLERMRPRLLAFAESFGVEGMRMNDWLPNTRRALALVEHARSHGGEAAVDAYREAAMNAYWREGANLESDADLGAIARKAGLDPQAAVAASHDEALLRRVGEVRAEANRRGVHAIPTFFIGETRIVGCQPYEVLDRALQLA